MQSSQFNLLTKCPNQKPKSNFFLFLTNFEHHYHGIYHSSNRKIKKLNVYEQFIEIGIGTQDVSSDGGNLKICNWVIWLAKQVIAYERSYEDTFWCKAHLLVVVVLCQIIF